jgi:hypothetical protein
MSIRSAIARQAATALVSAALGGVGAVGIRGDADGNGLVNFDDINAVNAHWGEAGNAWASHECDCEIVGPPPPTALERALEGAVLHTAEGWTVDGIAAGTNRVYIDVAGENEALIELIPGARYGSVRRLCRAIGPPEFEEEGAAP